MDFHLVQVLAKTLRALRSSVAIHDRSKVVFVSPPALGGLRLPGGTPFLTAISRLKYQDDRLATLLLSMLDGPWSPEIGHESWRFQGIAAFGLSEAIASQGLAVSLDSVPWQQATLPVETSNVAGGRKRRVVVNAWRESLDEEHRVTIDRHLRVLPTYENPGTHEPGNAAYKRGKAHLPANAERVLSYAVQSPGRPGTWWALCEHGFFHRFAGATRGLRPLVHWNGTTNPRASQVTPENEVPTGLRAHLESLEPARDCGCREQ